MLEKHTGDLDRDAKPLERRAAAQAATISDPRVSSGQNTPNENDLASETDQLLALAWVRGEVGATGLARAYGIPEMSTNEIRQRLTRGLKAWVKRQENVNDRDAPSAHAN